MSGSAAPAHDPGSGAPRAAGAGAARADRRRAALLRALDELLREQDLEDVNVADISHRAGVTRSAFYFYFENKAVATSALMAEVYDDSFVAATLLRATDETPRARIEAGLRGMFETLDQHVHLYRAMLAARAGDGRVRTLWDEAREAFVAPVAEAIESERAAGHAPPGPDASTLASLLLEVNDRVLEREARGTGHGRDQHVEAVTALWTRAIYGTDEPAGAPGPTDQPHQQQAPQEDA